MRAGLCRTLSACNGGVLFWAQGGASGARWPWAILSHASSVPCQPILPTEAADQDVAIDDAMASSVLCGVSLLFQGRNYCPISSIDLCHYFGEDDSVASTKFWHIFGAEIVQ
jgi:hypothetical protein